MRGKLSTMWPLRGAYCTLQSSLRHNLFFLMCGTLCAPLHPLRTIRAPLVATRNLNKKFLTNQKCFIITGKNVAYFTAFFNSSLFKYCFRDSFPELQGGTRELSKIFFDKIPVYKVSDAQNLQFQDAVEDIQKEYNKQKAQRIDSMLFDLYNLTEEERQI